jgi:DNA-binding Lrp family transcriptional regulator
MTVALSLARTLQLPEAVRRDLLQLVTHADQIVRFLQGTENHKPSASPGRFSRPLAHSLSISNTDAGRLLNALQNLQIINQETKNYEKTFEIITDRLTADVRDKWISAKAIILSILTLVNADHPAIISQKARRLSFEYERIFVSSDILTDLRPVFTSDGEKLLETIIQHKLVITQHDSSHRDSDIHFVLDARDVINLKNACERAIKKAKVLQDTLGSFSLVTEVLSDDEET